VSQKSSLSLSFRQNLVEEAFIDMLKKIIMFNIVDVSRENLDFLPLLMSRGYFIGENKFV
jgi:hypothetical protein